MKLEKQDLDKILEDIKPSIINGFKNELKTSIDYETKERVKKEIGDFISKWIKEEVIPEIEKELIESKEGLIKVAPKMAEELTAQITTRFAEDCKKNLENSWTRKKLFETLLG